ncbi:MAG: efflux RND transporter permease subunit [Micrococcales bacterium]
MHRLAKLSLANRSVVALITIIIAIAGLISMGSLRQELFPSIEVPQAAIVTAYPGASPTVVDSQVSRPIETAVASLDGVSSTSTNSQSSLSVVRVSFEFGTTTVQVKERLAAALAGLGTLPSTVEPKIISGSLDSIPVVVLGISANSGDNSSLNGTLSDVATPMLSPINGVRDVTISGVTEKRINLTLKESVLKANNLTQQSIVTALQTNGFVIPAGTINDSKGQLTIQVGTPVESIEAFKNLPLISSKTTTSVPSLSSLMGSGANTGGFPGAGTGGTGAGTPGTGSGTGGFPSGGTGTGTGTGSGTGFGTGTSIPSLTPTVTTSIKVLKVSDVATVKLVDSPESSISRVNGKPSLAILLTKTQDGNTVSISHDVAKILPELQKKLGAVTIVTVFDQAPYVEKSLESLTSEGLLGLGFAIVVILLFLLSVRSTLVTAISIPTSVLITFIGLNTAGYSLNLFTLSALTIAIGRVVDDSIVVIENINRHLAYGEPKKQAVLNAVREVASAVTAATITTVAVFLPIALVGGLVGQLFRPFAFTFAIALVASLAVSLTIVPVLAYWFMKAPKVDPNLSEEDAAKAAEAVREATEAKERKSWLQRGYLPVLKTTQAHPVVTLIAAFVVLIATFGLVPQLKTNFIGNSDSNAFVLTQELKAGASLAQKDAAAAKLEALLLSEKDVKVVQTSIGSTGDGRVAFGAAAGGIQHQITTTDGIDQLALQKRVLDAAAADSSMGTVKLQQGGSFGSSGTIDVKVTGTNEAAVKAGVDAVAKAMAGTKNVTEITNSLAVDQRTLQITVDRKKAAQQGLTEVAVSGIVAGIMNPSSIGKLNIDTVSTPIYVVKTDTPSKISEIKAIKIPTATGSVALSKIADVKEVLVPTSITSEKGDRTATVSLKPSGDNLGAITTEVTSRLAKVELPTGATASVGGVSKDQADSFGQLGIALLAAIAIVYIVMVATFRSILQPILLLTSIPFAATGAFVALLVTDTALGVPALIGMLLLVGIVVTNAIVLIDLMNQYREQGMPTKDAIFNGARQRLRPILMTALATIFALTPMAMGLTGGGGFISKPLAVVVIGGLFSSTLLTLVIVPVLYWLVAGRKERKAERAARGPKAPKRVKRATAKTA